VDGGLSPKSLKASRSVLMWRTAALVCRAVEATGADSRRWAGRAAYALRRAGHHEASAASYARAITGESGGQWSERIERIATAQAVATPGLHHGLGVCLKHLGDLESAAAVIRVACELSPKKDEWHETLAELEGRLGNRRGATWALLRRGMVRRDGDPEYLVSLAAAYDSVGRWADAQEVLLDNVRQHPTHSSSHKLLAAQAASLATWGGTFTGTEARRAQPLFTFGVSPALEPADALEQAVSLQPENTRWRAELAYLRAASGKAAEAIKHYETALQELEESGDRWALGVKQRWQFHLEWCYQQLGEARVDDPLFACELNLGPGTVLGIHAPPGLFNARIDYLGIRISGLVTSDTCNHVTVYLNGTPVRAVNVSRSEIIPRFTITLKRKTVSQLPRYAALEVRTPDGRSLYGPGGCLRIDLSIPHGDEGLLQTLADGAKLDKKGKIAPSFAEVARLQGECLEVYSRLREFFRDQLGRDVFLMYGTLLGYYRDGGFIPGDDDFDAGYVSDETSPASVKREAQELIVELIRAGFTVSFNWRGRLFRVHLQQTAASAHVDLRPLWFQGGKVWAHNHLSVKSTRAEFLPTVEGKLHDVLVLLPQDTKAFLRKQYGPGWRVPDPGFIYHPSDVAPKVRRNLNRALITAQEYKELARRVDIEAGRSATAGRLISLGSQDLYGR
jgi:tetratricopeptide (TPR) repeat protein